MTTTIERKLASEVENVPFCLTLNKDAGKYAKAETILKLKQFGKTIQFLDFDQIGNSIRREAKLFSKKFYPDYECFTDYEVKMLGRWLKTGYCNIWAVRRATMLLSGSRKAQTRPTPGADHPHPKSSNFYRKLKTKG